MSGFLIFTVEGKPQGKQRPRRGRNGRFYTPKETKAYERAVARSFVAAAGGIRPHYCGPVELEVVCYFSDRRRRDLDNVLKAVADALNGVAYGDDSQIVRAEVRREEGGPHTIVGVRWFE
jgi:Holliday junction resolvase RusA-like endonuclease